MTTALDKELIQYFVRLSEPQKRSLLVMIKSFLTSENTAHAESDTIEKYNKELDDAMKRIDRGEFTTLEDLEKEMKAW